MTTQRMMKLSSMSSVKRLVGAGGKRPEVPYINSTLRNNKTYGKLIREAGDFTCPISISYAEDAGYHHMGKDSDLYYARDKKYKRDTYYTQDTGIKLVTKDGVIVLGIFDGHGGDAYSYFTEKVAKKVFSENLDKEWRNVYSGYDGCGSKYLDMEKNKGGVLRKMAVEINKLTDEIIRKSCIHTLSGTTVNFVIIDRLSRSTFSYNLGDSPYVIFEPSYRNIGMFHQLNQRVIDSLYSDTYSEFIKEGTNVVRTRDHGADDNIEKKRAENMGIPIYQDSRGTWRLGGTLMVTGGYGDLCYSGLRRAYSSKPGHEDEGEVYRRDIQRGAVGMLTSDGIFESPSSKENTTLRFNENRIKAIEKYISSNRTIPNLAQGAIESQLDEIESIAGDYSMHKVTFGGEPEPWINVWDNHRVVMVKFN